MRIWHSKGDFVMGKTALAICLTLVSIMSELNVTAADHPSPEEVKKALTTWDQAFESGLFVTGMTTFPPSSADSDSMSRLVKSRYTSWGRNCAIDFTYSSLIPGTSRPAIEGIAGLEGSRDGVLLRHAIVFDEVKAAVYQKVALDYSDAGQPDPEGRFNELVYLYAPEDFTPAVPRYQFQWAMGRGFSRHLKEITSVEVAGDGRLRVTATGVVTANWPGRWELQVEPATAYLVREARFFNADAQKPQFRIATEGILDAGDLVAAQSGSYSQPLLEDREDVTEYLFESIAVQKNEEFFKEVNAIFDQEWPKGTWVLDRRGAKEKNTIVGSIPPPPKEIGAPPKRASGGKAFMIANLIGLAMLFLFLAIRGSRTREKSDSNPQS